MCVLKVCKSTATIVGCNKEKPETDFQRTGSTGRMGVCLECLVDYRRGNVKVKPKYEPSAETKLFKQFDKLTRTI